MGPEMVNTSPDTGILKGQFARQLSCTMFGQDTISRQRYDRYPEMSRPMGQSLVDVHCKAGELIPPQDGLQHHSAIQWPIVSVWNLRKRMFFGFLGDLLNF